MIPPTQVLSCFCDFGDVVGARGGQPSSIRGSLGTSCSEPGAGDCLEGQGPGGDMASACQALSSPSAFPVCSISNKELSELIDQLQKNADQVEKNIVDTEAKMQSVSAPHLPPGAPLSCQPRSGTRVLFGPVILTQGHSAP